METEPAGRDLGKQAEEEAAAAAAAQNAANCTAAANEASRISTEEANKSIAAAQNLAKEVMRAAQIPTPATPNPTQASASTTVPEEAPDPVRILRELLLCPPGAVPPRGFTPIQALEARGESLPDNIHPAWMEWTKFERLQQEVQTKTAELEKGRIEMQARTIETQARTNELEIIIAEQEKSTKKTSGLNKNKNRDSSCRPQL